MNISLNAQSQALPNEKEAFSAQARSNNLQELSNSLQERSNNLQELPNNVQEHAELPSDNLIAEGMLFSLLMGEQHQVSQHSGMGPRLQSGNNKAANQSISVSGTNGQINSVSTTSQSSLFAQVVSSISSSLSTLPTMLNNATQSFSLILPGQASLSVTTSVLSNGIRSLQLNSDEQKFQNWLSENASKLADALSEELATEVDVQTGASPV